MKNRILALIVALATVFALALNIFAIVDEATGEFVTTDPWSVLYATIYGHSGKISRDDYAGAWVTPDQKTLVVAVTEDGDMNFYRDLLKDFDNVEFVTHKYPLKALRILQDEVFDKLLDIMSGAGSRDTENVVDFMVHIDVEEARPLILQAMTEVKEKYGFPDGIENAFKVEYGIVTETAEAIDDVAVDRPQEAHNASVTDETV